MSEADSQEDAQGLVASVINVVDELITNSDRETIIMGLDAQIQLVQCRYTVLSAIRDSLTGDAEEEPEAELPLATEENQKLCDTAGTDQESLIVQHIGKHGPSMPGDIAAAIGVHSTKIGRIVSKSNQLAKDGKLIVIRLS